MLRMMNGPEVSAIAYIQILDYCPLGLHLRGLRENTVNFAHNRPNDGPGAPVFVEDPFPARPADPPGLLRHHPLLVHDADRHRRSNVQESIPICVSPRGMGLPKLTWSDRCTSSFGLSPISPSFTFSLPWIAAASSITWDGTFFAEANDSSGGTSWNVTQKPNQGVLATFSFGGLTSEAQPVIHGELHIHQHF